MVPLAIRGAEAQDLRDVVNALKGTIMNRIQGTIGMRAAAAVGMAVALLGIGIGAAVASIPAANGTINTCYSTRTGVLRVIDYPSKRCVSGERLLRWNQAGPSNIAALQGTPCSAGAGTSGTLAVAVSATDGQVSMQCRTVLSVAGTVALDKIDFSNGSLNGPIVKECAVATACATAYPLGTTTASVHLYLTSPFGYTCPGAPAMRSRALAPQIQYGECLNVAMTVSRAVPVTP
jgi:hypothetical protein